MKKKVNVNGKEITIVGTAHVSEKSKEEVRTTIKDLKPDYVAVELDDDRYRSLIGDSQWKELDVIEAIRQGKGYLLLLNLIMSIYQKRIGLEEGIKPGQELLTAIETAEEERIKFGLVDRNINKTLERIRDELTFWEKVKLFSSLIAIQEEKDVEIEDLKQENMISALVKELETHFPTLKTVFLDERNSYMAEEILKQDFEKAVVVVGAAHVEGLAKDLKNQKRHEEIETKGGRIPWLKLFLYGLPMSVILLLGYGYYLGGAQTFLELGTVWITLNFVLTLMGAVIAKAHPITWGAASLSAPITSLIPVIGAGFVAAYVESIFNPPNVEDMEEITELTSYKELWNNQVGVILLAFLFVSLGSFIATLLGAGAMASIIANLIFI